MICSIHSKAKKKEKIRSRMPRKSRANRARAANLQREKRYLPKQTVEEVEGDSEDSDIHAELALADSDSHVGCCEAADSDMPQKNDIIGDDVKFLDVIGYLRGTMVRDEDERSVSVSEESEDDSDLEEREIHEINALDEFSNTLQKAHDLALAAEREQENGKKRPKRYNKNSNRTKCRCHQKGCELAAKGFHSVKAWLIKNPSVFKLPTGMPEPLANDMGPKDFQESEESSSDSEDEIWPAMGAPVTTRFCKTSDNTESESGSDSDSELETMETVELWKNSSHGQKTPVSDSEESLDSEENERLLCRNAVDEMLKNLKEGKVPHDDSPETSTD